MEIKKGYYYYGKHTPSGEEWMILGIDTVRDRVCAAGWPATVAKLSDCTDLVAVEEMDESQLTHRANKFGSNWDN